MERDLPAGKAGIIIMQINEKLINEDLRKLSSTDNIISLGDYTSKIFQIDDGWEKALGDWITRRDRFPENFKSITDDIETAGYIPATQL